MKLITLLLLFTCSFAFAQNPNAKAILDKIDKNMSSENRVFTSEMLIHGRRVTRTIASKTYSVGDNKSFTEYLSPARQQGTKMLKLEDELWIYSPSTDRTIKIAGHMLKQSLMGSDLSYEDMMDDSKLSEVYNAKVIGAEIYDERDCWIIELIAIKKDVTYQKRKLWVDKNRYVPLKEELFAKSGHLLKTTTLSNIKKIEGRWYPTKIVFKDVLKKGEGTEFIIKEIKFDQEIPEYLFTKAALKK